jgi:hypothetical protein
MGSSLGGRTERLDEAAAVALATCKGAAETRQSQESAVGWAEAVGRVCLGIDALGHADELFAPMGAVFLGFGLPALANLGDVLSHRARGDAVLACQLALDAGGGDAGDEQLLDGEQARLFFDLVDFTLAGFLGGHEGSNPSRRARERSPPSVGAQRRENLIADGGFLIASAAIHPGEAPRPLVPRLQFVPTNELHTARDSRPALASDDCLVRRPVRQDSTARDTGWGVTA